MKKDSETRYRRTIMTLLLVTILITIGVVAIRTIVTPSFELAPSEPIQTKERSS